MGRKPQATLQCTYNVFGYLRNENALQCIKSKMRIYSNYTTNQQAIESIIQVMKDNKIF